MSGLKVFRLLLFIVLLPAAQPHAYSQESEAALKEQAAQLFESEKYLDATPLYLRLLALSPRSHDYNFRYGTCLLYNSYKKQDAFKYLNYAVTEPTIDVQAFFFLGKAYQLNYQFNEAIKNYELYKQKAGGKPKASFEVDRQIEMCQNGKRLLTTITDLVVLEKKESDLGSFFRKYKLDDIGGDILVAADYQSRIDKKKGHVPIIHFPAASDQLFYSSYGDSDKGEKDIYVRKRLPDGSWGQPQPVQGNVNTKYDEDFPYMHPNGEYLYFSSKGHNSMGGYDVFRAKYDPSTNSFGTPENMDFAISSPDNDMFYVVDSLDRNAYFASSRQSSNGNIHVYKVRVERVPLQLAVVKGRFASVIRPDNKKITIAVTDHASGTAIGTFVSNEKGDYLITLPKGGKYQYEMKVDGSTVSHKYVVTVPFQKEFRPLKQKIQEELLETGEVVKVVDQFNEDVEDPMGVLAEVIKLRSELNPNANQFDLQQLDAGSGNKQILAELGFENAGPQDIIAAFEQLENKQQEKVKQGENLSNGALAEASRKLDEAAKQQETAKALVNRASSAVSKEEKFALMQEAEEKVDAVAALKAEARELIAFSDSVTKKGTADNELLSSIEAVTSEVRKEVAAENMTELKNLITGNSRTIEAVKTDTEKDPVDALIEQKDKIRKDKAGWTQQRDSYTATEQALEAEIKALQASLATAKKKDVPDIESKIASKTGEKQLVTDEKENLGNKIVKATKQEDAVTERIRFLQTVTQVSGTPVSPAEVQQKLNVVDSKNNNTLASYIHQQVIEMEKDPALLASNPPAKDPVVENLEETYDDRIASINSETFGTPAEKTQKLLNTDREFASQLDAQLEQVETDLKADPTNREASQRKETLTALRTATADRIATREKELTEQSGITPAAQITPSTELAKLAPGHETALQAAKGTTPKATLQAKNAVDQQLVEQIDAALDEVYDQLSEDPGNSELKQRKQALIDLKDQVDERIEAREAEIAGMGEEPVATSGAAEELAALMPDYDEQLASATGTTRIEELEAKNRVDEELIDRIAGELEDVEGQLLRNPENPEALKRQTVLNDLKEEAGQRVEDRNEEIEEITPEPAATNTLAALTERIRPEYRENLGKIEATMEDGPKKELALLDEEKDLLTAIGKQLTKKEAEAAKFPDNGDLKKELADLKKAQTVQEAVVSERELDLIAIEQAKIVPERFLSDVMPGYRAPDVENRENYTEAEIVAFTEQEKTLQDQLIKRLRANEKKLGKTFDPRLEAENKLIATFMEQSVNRAQQLNEPVVEDETITERIAEDLGDDADVLMNSEPATVDEAKRIITELKQYEARLLDELNQLEETEPEDEEKTEQLKKQLVVVRKRIGTVEFNLDEMESSLAQVDGTSGNGARSELNRLADTEEQLEQKLASGTLPPAEKRATEKELATVRDQRQTQETAVLQEALTAARSDRKAAEGTLSAVADPTAQAALERSNGLTASQPAKPTKRELEQQLQGEEQAEVLLSTTNAYLDTKRLYDEKGLVTATRPELEISKRRFLVEIGQLDAALEPLKNDPSKTEEADRLRSQRRGLQEAVDTIDAMIAQLDEEKTPANPVKKGLDTPVSYEQEVELARSKAYPALLEQYKGVQSTQRQLADLLREKDKVRTQLATAPEDEEDLVAQLETLTAEEQTLRDQLQQEQTALDNQLNTLDAPAAYRNLLARDVPPEKAAPAASALVPAIGTGFELVATPPQARTVSIPVDLKVPTGLVYRVQVGAFAKPIPEELFREFTPVTGEKLTNGITRYLAGYFGNRTKVVDAQRQIRALGYTDAFVVAYCDGNRITLAEARRLEDLGLCVPKNQDSLLLEVAENTLAQLPADSVEKYRPAIKASDYNKAPGAVAAEAAEDRKGLYYTVQVGVYNRPVDAVQVKNIDPLITKRLPNGQIRYSSGIFPSVDAARPKKAEAIARGIADAFITAYFNGERISLDEAKRILAERGPDVLEKETTPVKPDAIDAAKHYAASQPATSTPQDDRIQFVSKERYTTYPREEIGRLNSHGSFYYDAADQRIKSVEYLPKTALEMLETLSDDLDTVPVTATEVLPDELKASRVVAVWESTELSGAAADWILRLTLPHTGTASGDGFELSVEGVDPEDREDLMDTLESFGAVRVIAEEEKQE